MRLRRYNHNRSNTRLSSYNMGEIVPTMARHCIQGTTLRGGVAVGLQMASLARQSLSQMRMDNFAISAPDRILWDAAEDFYTGGETGDVRPEVPYIVAPEGGWPVGSLADHLGFATGVSGLKCNALPFRLYAFWINENVIDPSLQEPLPISTASGLDVTTNTQLWNMNWPKDIFTTAVVEEQLGDEVVIPLATSAPVNGPLTVNVGADTTNRTVVNGTGSNANSLYVSGSSPAIGGQNLTSVGGIDSGLYADLSNASGVLPSDFNFAMARQAWKTRRNLYGHRFKDWLAFMGIKYSDRRLQLPSTLAHSRSIMDVNGVLQTAPGTDSYVGQRGGTASGYGRCSYKTYFDEPTTVIHLTCLRPAPLYVNIMPMEWAFEVREDTYTPEFAHVGMAELKKGILFPTGTDADNERWGFINRYDELRTALNDVSGAMKTTNLIYHQGRVFTDNAPELNGDFLECNPSPRIFNDMANSPQIEAAAIRNTFIERNIVSPHGEPKFR